MEHVQTQSPGIQDHCNCVIKGKKVLSGAPGDPFKYRKLNEFVSVIFKLRRLSPAEKGIKWCDCKKKKKAQKEVYVQIVHLSLYL